MREISKEWLTRRAIGLQQRSLLLSIRRELSIFSRFAQSRIAGSNVGVGGLKMVAWKGYGNAIIFTSFARRSSWHPNRRWFSAVDANAARRGANVRSESNCQGFRAADYDGLCQAASELRTQSRPDRPSSPIPRPRPRLHTFIDSHPSSLSTARGRNSKSEKRRVSVSILCFLCDCQSERSRGVCFVQTDRAADEVRRSESPTESFRAGRIPRQEQLLHRK